MKKPEIFYKVPFPVQERTDPLARVSSHEVGEGRTVLEHVYSHSIISKNPFGIVHSREITLHEQKTDQLSDPESYFVRLQTPLDRSFFESMEEAVLTVDDDLVHQQHLIRLFRQRMPHIIISPREVSLCILGEKGRIPLVVINTENRSKRHQANKAVGENGVIDLDTRGKFIRNGNTFYRTAGGATYPWLFEMNIGEGMPITIDGIDQKVMLLAGLSLAVPPEEIQRHMDLSILRSAFNRRRLHTHFDASVSSYARIVTLPD